MTREVAIRNLEMIRIAFVDPATKEQRKLINDTVDMAISALSDYEKMQKISLDLAFENDELMNKLSADGDCISRQAVLNTLDFADKALDEERTVEMYRGLLTKCIKVLPSVENKGDCISRQAVLDELKKWDWQELYLPIHFKENIIDVLPSVQPKKEDNTMDIYSDLLRVKHGTMSIDSLIDKVWCRERR